MRFTFGFYLVFILFSSCSHPSLLNNEFECKPKKIDTSIRETDFFENFSVAIPENWKKSYYYDDLQSEIFAADTTKIYTDTYMMEFTMINGNVQVDEPFRKKVTQKAAANQIVKLKDNFIDFKQKKGYYFYGKGKNKESETHIFQYYLKINNKQYFMVRTEIFGSKNVSERLCESLNVINGIEFKE